MWNPRDRSEATMKQIKIAAMVLCVVMLVSGCSLISKDFRDKYPLNPVSYEQKHDEDTGDTYIVIGDRTYSWFGTINQRFTDDTLRECIGYIGRDKNYRIYTLSDDPLDNYIMIQHTGGVPDQPVFLRAVDTRKKDIYTPKCIRPAGYESWTNSGVHYELQTVRLGLICNAENVKEIEYAAKINGQDAEVGGVRYASYGIIKKGDKFEIEISELRVEGKADKDKSFNLELTFTVTDANDQRHEVKGTYEKMVLLGATADNLELRQDDDGFYIFVDEWLP